MKLDYQIVRSERRTIGITVERDRRVIVRAPRHARGEAIDAAVERKRLWIWQKLRDPRKYAMVPGAKEFVAGEAFLFFGQNYSLELVSEPRGEVRLNGRRFELSRAERSCGRELFRKWFLSEARRHMSPRAAMLANAMGVKFKRISVRDLKYSWGSCAPGGTLTFNWRIVQAPTVVVDYLIVHELAHAMVANHSREFWNIVAVHAPAWEKARDWLTRHGSRMEW
jgi:predicted metal-dependent hydrolase